VQTTEWVQVDSSGMVCGRFSGSLEQLTANLRRQASGNLPLVSTGEIYLHNPPRKVRTRLVTLTTPWGQWRWVPVEATATARRPLLPPMFRMP
jgi:hypothetical protein